jgi:hypothetical protein
MRPFYTAATNVVQGLFAVLTLVVMADVASPTFNIGGIPDWSGSQAVVIMVITLTISMALGVAMHTISRSVFHKQKQDWTLTVLSSAAVRNRLAALGTRQPSPGGPTYEELSEESPHRVYKAAAFMHGIEYQVMIRQPEVFQNIQAYRDQYRMARSFILPCAVLALVLPFWAPIGALDGVGGTIGPLPIIRTQAFLVSVLAAAVCFVAFRERAYRYAAAKALAWVTLVGIDREDEADD